MPDHSVPLAPLHARGGRTPPKVHDPCLRARGAFGRWGSGRPVLCPQEDTWGLWWLPWLPHGGLSSAPVEVRPGAEGSAPGGEHPSTAGRSMAKAGEKALEGTVSWAAGRWGAVRDEAPALSPPSLLLPKCDYASAQIRLMSPSQPSSSGPGAKQVLGAGEASEN